jgi:predicted RNase H-like HicB family nuclease
MERVQPDSAWRRQGVDGDALFGETTRWSPPVGGRGSWPGKDAKMAEKLPLEKRYGIDIAWSDEDDVFIAIIPGMPYAGGHGATMEDALAMTKEAIRSHIEVAEESGKPIPEPKPRRIA